MAMSVINKMLRDLDQRGADLSTMAVPSATVLRGGTASVSGHRESRRAVGVIPFRASYQVLSGIAVVVTVAAGVWQLGGLDTLQRTFKQASDAPPAMPLPAAAPTPTPEPAPLALPTVAPAVVAVSPATEVDPKPHPVVALPVPSPVPLLTPKKPLAAPSALPPSVVPASLSKSTEKSPDSVSVGRVGAPVVAPVVMPALAASSPVPDPNQLSQRQLQAGRDALAQAQMLWSTGAKDAALDVLQQSIAVLERSSTSGGTPAHTRLLASMARELTRLQLADGLVEEAWALLVRLEPRLNNDPDLWAVRGHAAQRLGRHQDSVQAYTAALQSRPNEQRWLLGAVVSSAALGHMARATELLQKARGLGPVNREVQNYLKQMGLPIQDE